MWRDMSLLNILSRLLISRQASTRTFCLANSLRQEVEKNSENVENLNEFEEEDQATYDPLDRSQKIDVETSIRYLESEAFKKTYGGELIWKLYRRNIPFHFAPETRKKCIRGNRIATASPCPICRDVYLVLDYRNVKLLKQFLTHRGAHVLPTKKTGLCQMQHEALVVAVMKAKDYGTISYDVPFREYDYEYFKNLSLKIEAMKK